jgi:hypothetical protein
VTTAQRPESKTSDELPDTQSSSSMAVPESPTQLNPRAESATDDTVIFGTPWNSSTTERSQVVFAVANWSAERKFLGLL